MRASRSKEQQVKHLREALDKIMKEKDQCFTSQERAVLRNTIRYKLDRISPGWDAVEMTGHKDGNTIIANIVE
jgi:hypothetical protein